MCKSKKKIVDAFVELVSKTSILEVNNDLIMETAKVSKGTFYSHFHNRNDIIDYLAKDVQNNLFNLILKAMSNFPIASIINLKQCINIIMEVLFTIINQNRERLKTLSDCNMNYLWEDQMQGLLLDLISKTQIQAYSSKQIRVLLTLYCTKLVEVWVTESPAIPIDDFKKIAYQLSNTSLEELIMSRKED